MAALDFPSSPSNGQQYVGPGGVTWVYDLPGTKWVAATLAGGVFAPLVAPVFQGDARAVTPATGDADTSIATTAFVAASVHGVNYADNAGFAVNQRSYVSGTALAAAAFGHDRWKGGAGGGTYTFAAPAGPANTVTITAGTLQQVVEGASLIGGNYMLSWIGTAQGRVGAGSYAASPVSVAGITAGANTTIEFNTGTLGQVKFESGTVATPWQALPAQQDLAKCQRFYQLVAGTLRVNAVAGQPYAISLSWPPMRSPTPTPTLVTAGSQGNVTTVAIAISSASYGNFSFNAVASGDAYVFTQVYSFSADL
jgi:hypothetical protein